MSRNFHRQYFGYTKVDLRLNIQLIPGHLVKIPRPLTRDFTVRRSMPRLRAADS